MNRKAGFAMAAFFFAATASAANAPSFGTRVAECHGDYDYADLLPPATGQLGLDTTGITLFGTPVKIFLSKYSNEWDQESYAYTAYVPLDYPTLKQQSLKFHGVNACTSESGEVGKRSCRIGIPKAKSGKKFASMELHIREGKVNTAAICTMNLPN